MNKRFLTFLSIGVLNTLLDIGIFSVLIYIFGVNPINIIILNIISFSLCVVLSFFLNGKLTFKDKNLTPKKFIKYYSSSLIGMIINTTIVSLLILNLGTGITISKIIASFVVVLYNYKVSKIYIFEKNL